MKKYFWIFSLLVLIISSNTTISCQSGTEIQYIPVDRDWSKYPAILELDTKNDIFAIGDVHGDYEGLVDLLLASKLIIEKPTKPNKVKWAADEAVLVIPGDFLSKGPRSADVFFLLKKLQKSAAKAGGKVIISMGNHEALILANPNKEKKVKNFVKEIDDLGIKPHEIQKGTDKLKLGQFLQTLPLAVRVNDWFFIHAGQPNKMTMQELDLKIREDVSQKGFGAPILLDEKEGILEVRMDPRPWWEKKKDEPKESKKRLRNIIEELGVNHIVVGHQPGKYVFSDGETRKKGKMQQKFNGMIFFIDTGMESGKSDGAVLHISKKDGIESASAIFPGDKKKKELWTNK